MTTTCSYPPHDGKKVGERWECPLPGCPVYYEWDGSKWTAKTG